MKISSADGGAATPSATTEPIASQPGASCGAWASAEREQHDRRAEHRRRRERERVEPLGLALEQQARDRVEHRCEDDGERARRPPRRRPRAARPSAPRRRRGRATIPTIRMPVARSLWAKPDREQRDPDRHRRVRDRGDARVDVLLPPGDQRERDGAVDDAERERTPPGPPQAPDACPRAAIRPTSTSDATTTGPPSASSARSRRARSR